MALALNNTGSMISGMEALKRAAGNPGKTLASGNNYAAMHMTANAKYHGLGFAGALIATGTSTRHGLPS